MKAGRILRNPDAPRTFPRPQAGRDLERQDAERLEEIRQYFKDQYARREVVARTRTADGDELDWVHREFHGEPPDVEPPKSHHSDHHGLPQPFESPDPDAGTGPPGTVPMLRKPLDRITPVGTLQDYLAKGPYAKRVTPPDDTGITSLGTPDVHKYAEVVQPVVNYGTEGIINTWRPYVQWSNEVSLGQLWLSGTAEGGTGLQTVEVGSMVYYDRFGDWSPHLFLFYTTNGYTRSGDYLGGYAPDVKGWEQLSSTVYPGIRMAESVYGGDQYELSIKVMLYLDKWWIRIGNEWMGGFPRSLFTTSSGLYDQAAHVNWGGEVIDDRLQHPEPTWTQMGSGHFPPEGWSHAAFMRNMAYQSDPAGTMQPLGGYTVVTNPNAYQIAVDFSGTTAWGSNFYWGGPGGVE